MNTKQELLDRTIDEIIHERDWREREFLRIKQINLNIRNKANFKDSINSMSIPIIYAHWEGFCVSSFRIITSYLNQLDLSYAELINNLFTFINSESYSYLKGKQSFQQKCKFSMKFLERLKTRNYKIPEKFETKSNLNYIVLTEMLDILGIVNNFEIYKIKLNELVNKRNCIAHGENSIILNERDVEDYIHLIMEISDKIIICYQDYLVNKKYLSTK